MKKMTIFTLALALAASTVFAQGTQGGPGGGLAGQGPGFAQQPALKSTVIEGKLAFVNDEPAVVAKDKTYFILMPRFYFYAYKDGLKEGVAVKVEGYEFPSWPGQDKPIVKVVKATIAGKTYDFSAFVGQGGFDRPRSRGCGHMGGGFGVMGGRP